MVVSNKIQINSEVLPSLVSSCVNELANRCNSNYMLRVREERLNIFFTEKLEGWIREIQKNSAREKLGDLLEKVKGQVFEMWKILSPDENIDEDKFLDLWTQKVQEIKQLLREKRIENIKDHFLPPHIYNKYLDCGNESTICSGGLSRLNASWKKETIRNNEIHDLETIESLTLKDARRLKVLYSAQKQYWSSFDGQEEKSKQINYRIKELSQKIEILDKISKGLLPNERKITQLFRKTKSFMDKEIGNPEIASLLSIYESVTLELDKFDKRILSDKIKAYLDEIIDISKMIQEAQRLYKDKFSYWSDDFASNADLQFSILITSTRKVILCLDSLMIFNYQAQMSIKMEAMLFAKSLFEVNSSKSIDELIETERKKQFSELTREIDDDIKDFFYANLKIFNSLFIKEYKIAISAYRKEQNNLDLQANRDRLTKTLEEISFCEEKQNHVIDEYNELIKSFPNDFSVINEQQAWSRFIERIAMYKKIFSIIPIVLDGFKATSYRDKIPKDQDKDLFIGTLKIALSELLSENMVIPEWVFKFIPKDPIFEGANL
ncbi:MAG: hypothetical protein S4CHLAM20_15300 [Chlamydiia bacterium]|nr:hypothetical protein [Chlamydiia bacterium]